MSTYGWREAAKEELRGLLGRREHGTASDSVTVTITWDIPGEHHQSTATWPTTDEPVAHRQMVANILRRAAEEIEAGGAPFYGQVSR